MDFTKIVQGLGRYKYISIFIAGGIIVLLFDQGIKYTSGDMFCDSCHMHPHATQNWRFSSHFDNKSGVRVHCVECHLPPEGLAHLSAKITTGIRDVWGTLLYEADEIDWQVKSTRAQAVNHVYKEACLHCHQNLFPKDLSKKGVDAHVYYDQRADELRCINCHLDVGHFRRRPPEIIASETKEVYTHATRVDSFADFIECIPNSSVDFEMIALPGGIFSMGSPADEAYRGQDEGPQHNVQIQPFWIGKAEVSWLEYNVFYNETHTEKTQYAAVGPIKTHTKIDGITGPTAPYGNPDQGWGRGRRPAITMTHFAAEQYCIWLSQKTGKTYRLPTEAEWEYACRGGTSGAYFFSGQPQDYTEKSFLNNLFGADTSKINSFVIYNINSRAKTALPHAVRPNPYGLVHMLGNVREFCSDYYSWDAYTKNAQVDPVKNPQGPESGEEYVIRGGSYASDAADLRIARRDHTRSKPWMLTDPQIPKSKWWYSDCIDVGFRVVCEFESLQNK